MDRADRGCQVLAARDERTKEPRGPGHSHRGRRWPEEAFPRPLMPFSHRPSFKLASSTSSATRWILPLWKDRKSPGAGAADRLPRGRRCSWPGRPRRLRARPVGRKISGHCAELASQLGARRIPFFAFPQGVRRIIYTTNAIEALNSEAAPRRPGTRGHFPS